MKFYRIISFILIAIIVASIAGAFVCSADDAVLGENENKLFFKPHKFVENLKWMAYGMVGVFAVMSVIILATVILNRVSGK